MAETGCDKFLSDILGIALKYGSNMMHFSIAFFFFVFVFFFNFFIFSAVLPVDSFLFIDTTGSFAFGSERIRAPNDSFSINNCPKGRTLTINFLSSRNAKNVFLFGVFLPTCL